MSFQEDPRVMDAKAIPMAEMVDRLAIPSLRPAGGELVGPCPKCGGRDRFAINLRSHAYLCRRCGIAGGDQIQLARDVLDLSFREALDWLCGDRPAVLDSQEMVRRRKRFAAEERRRAEQGSRFRQQAIADAETIWRRARPGQLGVVRAYLLARGITAELLPEIPDALRFLMDHPYVKKVDGQLETMHRGPAMIAGILDASGHLVAVHQTWVDRQPPHGKARILWGGQDQPAKMVRGAKKGGAIRLSEPAGADTLIMGEGIETTLTAMAAGAVQGAAYWAGVDLGNMAGRAQRGPGMKFAGLPDMKDTEAFVPPDWVRRLIFIMDGDSDPRLTRHKLECGLRRAMVLRPGLKGQIVRAGDGVDLNDVLTGKGASE